jgi:AAA domain, putative AbiEii toxin, Type IV TA system
VSELGLGYQSVLAWVTDLASRLFAAFPSSPDPLAEPCVVLVDEIDIHLHPRWQRTLLDAVSDIFPNAQFIVTAHSPLIVQAAPDANLAVLRRRGDHVVIEQAPDAVRHWRVDQILTSDLFGLPSARPALLDAALVRRDAILAKDTLTPEDDAELAGLRERISHIAYGDVEHTRPKASYRQLRRGPLKRPGYYWLAYAWENLLFVCEICNRREKRSWFPLKKGSKRARSPKHRLTAEPRRLHRGQALDSDPPRRIAPTSPRAPRRTRS